MYTHSQPIPGPPMSTETKSTPIRHAITASDKQRAQLERLLKDPAKPVYIPPPPTEKTIRPPKDMMKNVQGSSAGAGSGEFHVYKANRRREYERIKLMEEESQKVREQCTTEIIQLFSTCIRNLISPNSNAKRWKGRK
jgi:hypothetical protein